MSTKCRENWSLRACSRQVRLAVMAKMGDGRDATMDTAPAEIKDDTASLDTATRQS